MKTYIVEYEIDTFCNSRKRFSIMKVADKAAVWRNILRNLQENEEEVVTVHSITELKYGEIFTVTAL